MSTTPVLYQPAEGLSESQWANLERTAARLAHVSWIPAAYKPHPAGVDRQGRPVPEKTVAQAEAEIMAAGLALLTIGRDLTPMSLKLVYVVNGTVDFMVDLIVAQVHEHGHEIWVVESDETHATVAGQRRGSQRVHKVTFDVDDARRAGLVGKDVWKLYVKDMLIARAAKRVAKRIAPEALLTLPPPMNYVITDSGRVQLADIVHEHDDPGDEEVYDAEIVGEGPPAHLDDETGEVGHATSAPPGPMPDDEQPEVYAKRQRWANAVMGEVGVKEDDARHELVRTATGGATQSTGRLTDWQARAIVDFCDRLKAAGQGAGAERAPAPSDQAAAPADRENAPGNPPGDGGGGGEALVGSPPPAPGPVPGEWRARAVELGKADALVLMKAREFAGERGVESTALPRTLDQVTNDVDIARLEAWLG